MSINWSKTSQNHEQIIVIVMISFWLISIIASIYLARVSVKPLIDSMQKQKSLLKTPAMSCVPFRRFCRTVWKLFSETGSYDYESSENIAPV